MKRLDKLVNVYTEKSVRLWFYMYANGGDDAYFEEAHDFEVGTKPDWWAMSDGLADIFYCQVSILSHEVKVEGVAFHYPKIHWMLENGIAPGQPFMVEMGPPHVSCSYEGEYDEEWDWEIVLKKPVAPKSAAKRWARFWRKLEARRAIGLAQLRALRDKVARDVTNMRIQGYHYGDNYGRAGVSFRVVRYSRWVADGVEYIRHGVRQEWGEGRDDAGDREKAMKKLIETACAQNRYLTPSIIQEMEVRW